MGSIDTFVVQHGCDVTSSELAAVCRRIVGLVAVTVTKRIDENEPIRIREQGREPIVDPGATIAEDAMLDDNRRAIPKRLIGDLIATMLSLLYGFSSLSVYCPRVLGQWFDGIRFYAAASSPRRSRRTWAGLR